MKTAIKVGDETWFDTDDPRGIWRFATQKEEENGLEQAKRRQEEGRGAG